MKYPHTSRRDFIKTSTVATAGALTLSPVAYAKVLGANEFKEEFKAKNDGQEEMRLPVKPRRDLEGNFIDVLRGKDKLACNAELGCATMVAIKMAVESYRQKKTMIWNAKKERVMS